MRCFLRIRSDIELQLEVVICLMSRYQMVITVNITCLLALASVYMGVATSLPSTANIKPVEFYLIYNLAYPFLTILLAVYIQVHQSL